MSDIIKLLPDSVANQIAAGEVIQRPSSVIKELVENAIDAEATHIQVVVVDAGKSLVQVIDDGKGMSETDARLAFERHATSKIREAADLFALRTMGFRGEALASIAAVAQVELRTRVAEDEVGVKVVIEGSRVKEQVADACPVGANFAVRNLFFNIPARRKFLKSNQTEMTNILSEFERIVLAHPDISFTLYNSEVIALELPAGNFRRRILDVFGKKLDGQLIPVEVDTPLAHIHGFVGSPQSSRKKGARQFFFTNGRFMRHPYFAKAVQSAFERLIPDGEQVPFFLYFDIDPDRIDVNIHPAKTEIKFQDEQAIWQILLAAVREALGKHNAIPTIDFDTENSPEIPAFASSEDSHLSPPDVRIDPSFDPFAGNDISSHHEAPRAIRNHGSRSESSAWMQAYEGEFSKNIAPDLESEAEILGLFNEERESKQGTSEGDLPSVECTIDFTDCFQYRGRFIITHTPSGLLFVDQHRAHIRILYDIYMSHLTKQKGISQGLLFPQELQLSSTDAVAFDALLTPFANLGFDISSLGAGTYSIIGIPAGTEGLDPVDLLQKILEESNGGIEQVGYSVNHHIALSLARRAALPVGQALSIEEMKDLLDRLLRSSNANYDPSGRIICHQLPADKIESIFH